MNDQETPPTPSPSGAEAPRLREEQDMDAELLARLAAGSTRLYGLDFLGRRWLAEYVADVDTLAMAMEDRQPTAAPRLGDAQGMAAALMDQWRYLERVRPRRLDEAAPQPTAAAGDGR